LSSLFAKATETIAGIPVAIVSIAPIVQPSPGRGVDLHVRVSAPIAGAALPVIIFSHGNGQSLHAYSPLADYWAAHGFFVIQPTHLDSRMLGLAPDDPRRPQLWRFREEDLLRVLDGLDHIETKALMMKGRLDRARIAVAGHSWGGQTASTLLGATHPDPDDGSLVSRKDDRVKAGVLLTVPGSGGKHLSDSAAHAFPFMHPDFSTMTTPTLIVAGDHDKGGLTVRGPDWWGCLRPKSFAQSAVHRLWRRTCPWRHPRLRGARDDRRAASAGRRDPTPLNRLPP
jgi:predicted dienelactone hydrolase